MNKLARLRADCLAAPLGLSEDALHLWAEAGRVRSHASRWNANFSLHYTASLVVEDWAGDPEALFWFLTRWIARHETNHGSEPITWEADILDNGRSDILFRIPLSETLTVTLVDEGVNIAHCDDPDLNPIKLCSPDWRQYINDELHYDSDWTQQWLYPEGACDES